MKFYAIQVRGRRIVRDHKGIPAFWINKKMCARAAAECFNDARCVEVRVEIVGPVEVRKRKKKA